MSFTKNVFIEKLKNNRQIVIPSAMLIVNFIFRIWMISFCGIMVIHIPLTAATHTVCADCTLKNLHEALDYAKPCDTILVQKGIYHGEVLEIRKSITFIGQDHPILDGQEKNELISVKTNDVNIIGFQLINAPFSSSREMAGINVYNASNINISNNQLRNTCFGIYLANVTHCTVQNNSLHSVSDIELNAGNGIHAWKCDHLNIASNEVSGHRDGIYFEFVTKSLITDNQSYENLRYGLHFMFSHEDEYRNNRFENNGAGVAVMYTKKVTMLNNQFIHNWGDSAYGLLLKDISDSHIENNIFDQNTIGIQMEGSSRIVITNNTFTFNGWAVQLQASCDNNNFLSNNFNGNTFDIATNGTLVLNTINGNYWDKYEGYDLDKDGIGDVPYRPTSLYAMLVSEMPFTIMLWRSFVVYLLDRMEKVIPSITPESLIDAEPLMKKVKHDPRITTP